MKRALTFLIACTALALSASCKDGWPRREVPAVRGALAAWDAGDLNEARTALGAYLESGSCAAPPPPTVNDRMRAHGPGTYDYALLLRELEAGTSAKNDKQKACVVAFLESFANDTTLAGELRARAALLLGNLHYADKNYPLAIKAYDLALAWSAPSADFGLRAADAGPNDGTTEERAAYNRALALRQIAPPPPDGGSGGDGGQDGGGDGGQGLGDGGKGGGDGGGKGEQEQNGDAGSEPQEEDAGAPQGERRDESPADPGRTEKQSDGRVLDALENAPMFEVERMRKQKRKPRTSDK